MLGGWPSTYWRRAGILVGCNQRAIWHYRTLMALGLPVVCVDARHAKAALALQLNKTDADDAFGLAPIVFTRWYRGVAVKASTASH